MSQVILLGSAERAALPTSNSFKDGDYLGQELILSGALQVRTDFGKPGYGGPCPPQGDHPHRYLFTIHAVSLDQLPVTADTSAAVVGFYLNFNTLAKASLMGLYKR
ncbi:MAG: YbhB/YbcL family Raf kinase inhibitor-like protein [Candidatus Methylomirabilia bacterium]